MRAVPARPSFPSRDFESPARRPPSAGDDSGVHARTVSTAEPARGGGASPVEPATVRPRRFDQAQELADKFKEGLPVILNLEATEREVARRLIDFASGICYALDGSMEKVATGVYLLKPAPQRVHRIRRLRRLTFMAFPGHAGRPLPAARSARWRRHRAPRSFATGRPGDTEPPTDP